MDDARQKIDEARRLVARAIEILDDVGISRPTLYLQHGHDLIPHGAASIVAEERSPWGSPRPDPLPES